MPKKKAPLAPIAKISGNLNRHGLPLVGADHDLGALFGVEADKPDPEVSFVEALRNGLADHGLAAAAVVENQEGGGRRRPVAASRRQAGKPVPEAELDLHGARGREAEARTDVFVRAACRRGLKLVLIITGRGLHSPGGFSVLQEAVEGRLRELKREGLVKAHVWEKKNREQSGAILVSL